MPIYTSSPGDSSIGMNVAWHELMNDSALMIDPNLDVNEVCAIILAGKKNGCVILGGGSPKNFYLQGQPTLWEVYGIPEGRQRVLHPDHDRPGRLGRAVGRDAVGSGELGQGQSRRPARYRRRLLRLDDRVPAVLRVRGRQQARHAASARSSTTSARRWSPSCAARASGDAKRAARAKRRKGRGRRKRDEPKEQAGRAMGTLASELRSFAAELAAAPRVYADANLPAGVVAAMRQELGWDVLFVARGDRTGAARRIATTSTARSSSAARSSRSIRTSSTIDGFPRSSPGVIVCSAPDESGAPSAFCGMSIARFSRPAGR